MSGHIALKAVGASVASANHCTQFVSEHFAFKAIQLERFRYQCTVAVKSEPPAVAGGLTQQLKPPRMRRRF